MTDDEILWGAVDRIRDSFSWKRQYLKHRRTTPSRYAESAMEWIENHVEGFAKRLAVARVALRVAWGINPTQHQWRHMSEGEAAQIAKLYLDGRSVREIETMTKRSYESIRARLHRDRLYDGKYGIGRGKRRGQ